MKTPPFDAFWTRVRSPLGVASQMASDPPPPGPREHSQFILFRNYS